MNEPFLRRRSLFGALGFCIFSIFWTTMAFLLSGAPYHYNDLTIGLFGLVGAAGGAVRELRRTLGGPSLDQADDARLFSLAAGVVPSDLAGP